MPVPVSAARPSLGHLFPGGGRGVGLGSQSHHSGYPQPWVWTKSLAQKWPSGDGGTSRKVRAATPALSQPHCPTLPLGHCQLSQPSGPPHLSPSLSWALPLFLLPAACGGLGPGALPETPRAHPPATERKLGPEGKETCLSPSPRPSLIHSTDPLNTP